MNLKYNTKSRSNINVVSTSYKIKRYKKKVNYTINKQTIDRFKVVAYKDIGKMSNIVGNLIRRYVESRV